MSFATLCAVDLHAETPTDRLIVRLKGGAPATGQSAPHRAAMVSRLEARTGHLMRSHRVMGDGSQVIKLFRRLSRAEIANTAHLLRDDPDVVEVVPDRIAFPTITPNDPLYANQWALSAASGINAPLAWNITTGAANLIVGVIDTGRLDHADLAGRWIGGYDFVSDSTRSNDTNGRDSDPSDPGDWVTTQESAAGPLAGCPPADSRWHGTAMAGIIAANGNNAIGMTGINWSSKVLPVRVVGKCGGYTSDIADGMRWAVGIPVPGTPANANTAEVLNVSLAAFGACDSVFQSAINEVVAAGVPIIVSAGNSSQSASSYSPGNCAAVITVGAVDANGGLPSYANTGSPIALSAPGGLGNSASSAILTTSDSGITTPLNDNVYPASNGTSIAAAHVTGVASLMLSLKPTLAPREVADILRNTARTFPTNATAQGSANNCSAALCGQGIVDAHAALRATQAFGDATAMVSGGYSHVLALRVDGTVYQWGDVPLGMHLDYPTQVAGLTGIVQIATGTSTYNSARRADGTVWTWGANNRGALGDGTTTNRATPVQVQGLTGVVEIAAGEAHGLARRSDGTVWAWGSNDFGQLGDGTQLQRNSPVPIAGLANVVALAATGLASFAVKSDGTVWQWGSAINVASNMPVQVTGLSGIVAVFASNSLYAIRNDGTLWVFGDNTWGQYGIGNTDPQSTPLQVPGLSNVVQVRGGAQHVLALTSDGTVWAWGDNSYTQLGGDNPPGTGSTRLSPGVVNSVSASSIGAGAFFSVAIMSFDGSVIAWGSNANGQLGVGPFAPPGGGMGIRPTPVVGANGTGIFTTSYFNYFQGRDFAAFGSTPVSNTARITGIVDGSSISVAGGEYSIGCTGAFTSTPATINNNQLVCMRAVASIYCGTATTATLNIAGTAYGSFEVRTSGCNGIAPLVFYAIGNAELITVYTSNPVTVTGINYPTPAAISIAGGSYSIGCDGTFTTSAGTILDGQSVCVRTTSAAANNTLAQAVLTLAGTNSTFNVTTKVAGGFTTAAMVTGGFFHSLAVRFDGVVLSWGQPNVINGATPATPYSMPVFGLTGIVQVAAGYAHSYARRGDGVVSGWGHNAYGELGDGTFTDRPTPVPIGSLSNIASIATREFQSFAARNNGDLVAWGNYQVPYNAGNLAAVANIAIASNGSRFALKNDGTVWQAGSQVAGLTAITSIAAGGNLLALKSDGTVWSRTGSAAAQQVAGLANVVQIASGASHSLALRSDGTVWSWGSNASGQLGDGTFSARATPGQVPALTQVAAIGAGTSHSLAIRADGSVFAWGSNATGELGIGAITLPIKTPTPVVQSGGYVYLSTSSDFLPQTGAPPSSFWQSNPVRITGIANASAISVTGGDYSVGCTGTYTSAPGTIDNNQVVCARLNASGNCNATTSALVNIAGLATRTYSVTTACDSLSDPFGPFAPQAGVEPGTVATSNIVSVRGIHGLAPATISITGGSYSIGCTPTFTSAPGRIVNGYGVCVRQTASADYNTSSQAVLTIGGASASFDVITKVAPGSTVFPMVGAAASHALGLRADGTIFGWGNPAFFGVSGGATPVPVSGLSGAVQAVAGNTFSMARRPEGAVFTWGTNAEGQLGDGTNTDRSSPLRIAALTEVLDIAAGDSHGLARKSDGSVWAWGRNHCGQLGDGLTASRSVPAQVPGIGAVLAIGAGNGASYAVRIDGTLWRWGCVHTLSSPAPTQVAELTQITAVSAGVSHVLALRDDGTVWAAGGNTFGQLGDGGFTGRSIFQPVPGLGNVIYIRAAGNLSMALKNDGTVWAWGDNTWGQLGDGTRQGRKVPVQVTGLTQINYIAAGGTFAVALRSDGATFTWGLTPSGAIAVVPTQLLGVDGDDYLNLAGVLPKPFPFLSRFEVAPNAIVTSNAVTITGLAAPASISIANGEYSINGAPFTASVGTVLDNSAVTVRTTSAAAFESNSVATLNVGGSAGRSSVFHVRTRRNSSAAAVTPQAALGDVHSLLLATNGTALAFGYNGNGQLGNGTTLSSPAPRTVAGLAGLASIASGAFHGLGLRGDGTVAAWGWNSAGQLGNGGVANSELYPVEVAGLGNIAKLAAGNYHSLALSADGTVWAWGLNAEGQAGTGALLSRYLSPTHIAGLNGVIAIAGGGRHSLALRVDGTVVAWGANESGQLGDGTTTQRNSPVPIPGLTGVVAIAAGDAHSLAIKSDGSVVAWGFNGFGQLGDGTNANRLAPVAVPSLGTGVGLIAAGANHSLAVKVGGALYSWGNNANSQLGNGNNANQSTPVLLATPTAVVAIAAGARHSAAIDASRKLNVWGDNFFGQVGNRSGNYNPHSASLNILRGDALISTDAGGSGTGIGTGSASGSSVIEIDGRATGFDFGSLTTGAFTSISGKFKNQSPNENIDAISVAVTGGAFSLASSDCPASLAPFAECSFSIAFNPASALGYSGELVIASSVVGSPERRSLNGTGVPPAAAAIAFAKSGLDFPPQTVGASTLAASYVFGNSGNAALTVSSVSSSLADFTASHNCTGVSPNASCTVSVTFTPTQSGSRTAYLTLNSNASGTPHTVTVSGTGVATIVPPANFMLSVARAGAGSGTVSANAGAISCGSTCAASYAAGASVTLTAVPNVSSVFAGWSGACTGFGACIVTMNAARSVTATFARSGASASDFNADGRPDILWSNTANGSTYLWHMNGASLISDAFIAGIDPSWKIQGVADFNGDGKPDLVWRNTTTGNTYVWYMNGSTFISDAFLFSLPPEWVIQGVADFNADGKPDFLMRNTNSGVAFAWFFNDNVAIGDQFLFGIDPQWKVEAVADLNHDGQPDLLFRNMSSGLAFAWNTSWNGANLALAASSAPIFGIDPVWEIVQMADWNGDGEPDLLFRNRNSGLVFVWYLNGTTLAGSNFITQIDPSWEIVPRR